MCAVAPSLTMSGGLRHRAVKGSRHRPGAGFTLSGTGCEHSADQGLTEAVRARLTMPATVNRAILPVLWIRPDFGVAGQPEFTPRAQIPIPSPHCACSCEQSGLAPTPTL